MDVEPWRSTLAMITRSDGWIGRADGKANSALGVLAGYGEASGWIGHGFPADAVREFDASKGKWVDRSAKPDAAYAAELKRDAVLQLALIHELVRWEAQRERAGQPAIADLTATLIQEAMSAPVGLRAKAASQSSQSGRHPEVDFAHGDDARAFFENVVRDRLARADDEMGTTLVELAGDRYDPADEASIERWGRAWTAGAAVVCLDWVRQKACFTATEIARAIWCQSDPQGAPLPRFYPRGAVIPTSTKLVRRAHAELRTRPSMAYALAGSEAIRNLNDDEPCSLTFALKAIDYVTIGSSVRYNGYNGSHLYLTVWSDLLHVANGEVMAQPGRSAPQSNDDDAQREGLAPEYRAALDNMDTARQAARALKRARSGHRFSTADGRPASLTPQGKLRVEGTTLELEPVSQRSLRFLPESGVPGARWQPIGSVELWRALGELEWIEHLVVARVDGRQIALPITLEDKVADDEGNERSVLVLDEGAPSPISAERLRGALADEEALIGVSIRKGLGALVVLEIAMDRASSANRSE